MRHIPLPAVASGCIGETYASRTPTITEGEGAVSSMMALAGLWSRLFEGKTTSEWKRTPHRGDLLQERRCRCR